MFAVVGAMVALGVLTPSHARSEGRSTFIVDDAGRVRIEIEIGLPDVPELCNADLLVSEARRAEMESKLASCLEQNFSSWLRIHGDDKSCKLAYDHDELKRTADSGTLIIYGVADCGAVMRVLVIDWGLFAASALDHGRRQRVLQRIVVVDGQRGLLRRPSLAHLVRALAGDVARGHRRPSG